MAKKVAIIGAGQAGLQLGLSLLEKGHSVTIISDKSGEDIAAGKILATPALFWRGQKAEHELGVDFWKNDIPPAKTVNIDVRDDDSHVLMRINGKFTNGAAHMVDLRLKYPKWIETFIQRGGRFLIGRPEVEELDNLAAEHDLVFVGTGRGNASLFERDAERSIWSRPLRRIRAFFLDTPGLDHWNVTFVPGAGEILAAPALGLGNKQGQAVLLWAVPGGPLDFPENIAGPQVVASSKEAFRRYNPEHYETIADKPLIDDKAWLAGEATPIVRKPVALLPSGRFVVAIGDAAVTVDPLTGQGLNNASYTASVFAQAIERHGNEAFTPAWANATANEAWDYIRHAYLLNRVFLEPLDFQGAVFEAASQNSDLADQLISAYSDPQETGWIHDQATVRKRLEAYAWQAPKG